MSKFGQGRKLVKNVKIWKVLRMSLPIVENLSGLQESIFSLSRSPQLHSGEKSKNVPNFIKFTDFPLFPLFGVPWAAVIFFPDALVVEGCGTSSNCGGYPLDLGGGGSAENT